MPRKHPAFEVCSLACWGSKPGHRLGMKGLVRIAGLGLWTLSLLLAPEQTAHSRPAVPGMDAEPARGREHGSLGIFTFEVCLKFGTQQILPEAGNLSGQKAQSCRFTAFSVNFLLKCNMLTEQDMNSKCPARWNFTKSEYTCVAGTEIKKQNMPSIPETLVLLCVQLLSLNRKSNKVGLLSALLP